MAFGETLAGLIAEVPKAMCEPATLASVLRKSNELAELESSRVCARSMASMIMSQFGQTGWRGWSNCALLTGANSSHA
jgi:hypothetical protein